MHNKFIFRFFFPSSLSPFSAAFAVFLWAARSAAFWYVFGAGAGLRDQSNGGKWGE
jgi:hypothetical protein